MGSCNCFTRVEVSSKKDSNKIMTGYIVWRQDDCFGLDVFTDSGYKVYKLSYNKWNIKYDID